MAAVHRLFAFGFVIMVGDNFYGSQTPPELARKFDVPYRPLLDAGVTFYAAIGNHDEAPDGELSAAAHGGTAPTPTCASRSGSSCSTRTSWTAATAVVRGGLQQSSEPWKIAYFHHPLYGNAKRHGSPVDIRVLLEPLLVATA